MSERLHSFSKMSANVHLHGADAQVQSLSDLRIRQPLADKLENLFLREAIGRQQRLSFIETGKLSSAGE